MKNKEAFRLAILCLCVGLFFFFSMYLAVSITEQRVSKPLIAEIEKLQNEKSKCESENQRLKAEIVRLVDYIVEGGQP